MKLSSASLALSLGVLVACSQQQSSLSGLPKADHSTALHVHNPNATSFTMLYSFKYSPDGVNPVGSLTAVGNRLFGTTSKGGTSNDGTIFVVRKRGKESVVHSFKYDGTDGVDPESGLAPLFAGNLLYGTTAQGGANYAGTVYSLNTSDGTETVMYSFKGIPDGAQPLASLTRLNGKLYGTTSEGGATDNNGTVFEITADGSERVVYSFNRLDGSDPEASLLASGGALFGTTRYGGSEGRGNIFEVTTGGTGTNLHSFKGIPDGAYPLAGLTLLNGIPYGTTASAGNGNQGTVYETRVPSGGEETVYAFVGRQDGNSPQGNLVAFNGLLYGTTTEGGTDNQGTVFELNPADGTERLVHSFNGTEGAKPRAGLIVLKGALYGTTEYGGQANSGTVFKVIP